VRLYRELGLSPDQEHRRFDPVRRLAAASATAIRKRHHRLERRLRELRVDGHARKVLDRPLRWLDGRPPPRLEHFEVRVLIVAERPEQVRPQAIAGHFSGGADRVVLALPRADAGVLALLEQRPHLHVAVTAADDRGRADILRHLLHQCGRGHWSLVVGPDEWFSCGDAEGRPLRDLCGDLDSAGFDALRCDLSGDRLANDGTRPDDAIRCIASVIRDELTGRVFVAQVDIDGKSPSDEDRVCSRVALMRYRSEWAMAADLRAVAGCREANFRGVISRLKGVSDAQSGASSAPKPAIAVEMRHSGD
jgi:hypothetical protein